jgi:recombination protein RecT
METQVQKNGQNLPVKKVDILKGILNAESVMTQFKNALKDNAPLFVTSIIDLYNGDAYLQKCEPKEVVMEALKAAVLKLPINKALGFAYLVPYSNSVKTATGWEKKLTPTFQIGYKGYIQLAMRTGQYRIINADKVYEGEVRTINKLTGEIDFSGDKKSDKVVGYFAYIEMTNGFSKTLYKTTEQVTAHAERFSKSYASKSSPWKTDFDAMALKTVISNLLSHYGFLSVEMMGAVESDERDNAQAQYNQEIDMNANAEVVDFEEADEVTQFNPETGEVIEEIPQPNF